MLSNLDILTNDLIQEQELRSAIIRGLIATPKTLPNILLWDDAGHELFKQITKSRSYYGPQADREIIQDRVDEICRSLGEDGVLIELGAGTIPHTSKILDELCRRKLNTQYIAHDLCQNKLDHGLCRLDSDLRKNHPTSAPKLRGVVGTYEQFFEWLSKAHELRGRRVVVIWLGNCLSHYSDAEFPVMIEKLMHSLSLSGAAASTLLLAVNGCGEADVMRDSYDSPDGTSIAFVANALRHANCLLGSQTFEHDSWTPISSVDHRGTSVNWKFRLEKRSQLVINDRPVSCKVGEDIDLITILKRDEEDVAKLLVRSEAQLVDIWRHPTFPWNWFVIASGYGGTGNITQALNGDFETGLCNTP